MLKKRRQHKARLEGQSSQVGALILVGQASPRFVARYV